MDQRKLQSFIQKSISEGVARVTESGCVWPPIHVSHSDKCRFDHDGECTCDPEFSFDDNHKPVSAVEVIAIPNKDITDSN